MIEPVCPQFIVSKDFVSTKKMLLKERFKLNLKKNKRYRRVRMLLDAKSISSWDNVNSAYLGGDFHLGETPHNLLLCSTEQFSKPPGQSKAQLKK